MITVQEVLRAFYDKYVQNHKLSQQQAKASQDIMNCRTEAMGTNASVCDNCGHIEIHYNSCRNRHCTLCQGVNRAIWVDNRSKDIINAPHFHLVFTMPQQLQLIIYQNQKLLYTLMYKAAAETITELSADEKYLGAQVGFFSLLHTWSQDLHYHPHIHTVLMAGGLTTINKWRQSSKDFFIPVAVLSKKFRGKYLHYLKQYFLDDRIEFYGEQQQYQEPEKFQALLNDCYALNWYTYVQETFSGPHAVIKYLGRYTHQVAIANSRIVSINDDAVIFTAKDEKRSGIIRTVITKGEEFIRRFLMHVLPKGFVKVRYYGIFANINKKTKLALCRKLTNNALRKLIYKGLNNVEVASILAGIDLTLCKMCGLGTLQSIYSLRGNAASP